MTDPLPAYDPADPSAYVASRLALVGDRDPVALLAAAPERVRQSAEGLSEAGARAPEPGGGWSVLRVLRHLADSEVVYGYRLRQVVASERPAIAGYDQEEWADALQTHRGTVADALADYADARRGTVAFLRALTADQWERVGVHGERGPESVRRIAALLAAHDLGHERQIARVRRAVGG